MRSDATVSVPVRWVLIPMLFILAVVSVYSVCHVAGAVDTVIGMARRISFGALFALGFWSASTVLQRWMGKPVRPATPTGSPLPPVPTFAVPPTPTGPGQYRVRGVDHDTHFQTSEVVYADSPSNAQLKVELKGVVVAAVERAG
jgi:hypothetical protein